MKGLETSNRRKAKWACYAACLCLTGLILHLFANPFSAMLPSAADDASVHHGSQPVFFWKYKKTGSSTMAMLLAVRAARGGARIAPCSTVAKACGSPVVPLLQRVLPAASGFGYVPHDVVLNHCHCPIAANGHWARSVALNMALFGGRSPVEIMTVRQPLSRLLSMYYWFGGSKRFWAEVPGVQDGPLTSQSTAPSVRDAMAFASAPQLYTKGGAFDTHENSKNITTLSYE